MGNNSNNSQLQSDIALSYALWQHQVVISMLSTCCADMATHTTTCPYRQNQATFGSFVVCTLPIAGDFEYLFLDPV